MRTSCNGCRVLRKGCGDDCVIRPCLHWIKSPEAQANATVFLAKFYGRAGLLNLLNAGPDHLRPAIFQSLLYEACGRVVDPVYGSVGLLYSGQWQHCQVAVDAVLKGNKLPSTSPEVVTGNGASSSNPLQYKLYDIRHMTSSKDLPTPVATASVQTRSKAKRAMVPVSASDDKVSFNYGGGEEDGHEFHSAENNPSAMFSAETSTEGSVAGQVGDDEVGLELTLGNRWGWGSTNMMG